MSFTNSQLAQKISDLIGYWTTFLVEHKDWLGGEVGGGPGLDGKYPLTDWNGNTSLIDAPAQLANNVNSLVTGAQGYATAASASADAAAASASTATTQAGLSDTARIAAETARTQAQTAETGATDAKVTAIAQANLATDRAGYAQEWANLGYQVPVSVAAGGDGATTFSAKHWAQIAENFSGSIDSNLYAKLADNEIITGLWTFPSLKGTALGTNIAPSTNGWSLDGYGLMVSRAAMYITNASTAGGSSINFGIGGVHAASTKFVIYDTFVQSNVNLYAPTLVASDINPSLRLVETDASVDNKNWWHGAGGEGYYVRAYNDSWSAYTDIVAVQRTGTVIDQYKVNGGAEIELNATLLDFNGQLEVSGSAFFDNAVYVRNGASVYGQMWGVGLSEGRLKLSNGSNWGLIAKGVGNSPQIGAYNQGLLHFVAFADSTGNALDTTKGASGVVASVDFANEKLVVNGTLQATTIDRVWKDTFADEEYRYDSYDQAKYLRMYTENATFDNARFCTPSNVEYHNGSGWVAWSGGDVEVKKLLDGREDTQTSIDHTHRRFRFEITRNSPWPTTCLIVLQSNWTAIAYPGATVTVETWDGVSAWVTKSTCTFDGTTTASNWGVHMKAESGLHDGKNPTRITIEITDWIDSGAYTTAPLKRFMMLSNYSGASIFPWTWDFDKTVAFTALTVGGASVTSTLIGQWNTAYGWGDHASAGYLTDGVQSKSGSWNVNLQSTAGNASLELHGAAAYIDFSLDGTGATDYGARLRYYNDYLSVDGADLSISAGNQLIAASTLTCGFLPFNPARDTVGAPTDLNNEYDNKIIRTGSHTWHTGYPNSGDEQGYSHVISLDNSDVHTQILTDRADGGRLYIRSKAGTWLTSDWNRIWSDADFANNSANWDTAYGWGNHASAGYAVTSGATYTGNHFFNDGFTIGNSISRVLVNDTADAGTRLYMAPRNSGDTDWNWAAEFGWNHTNQRWYFDGSLDVAGVTLTSTKFSNWDTAYGWGNHASGGYLKADGSVALSGTLSLGSQILQSAASYRLTAAEGAGIGFWNSSPQTYGIYMGTGVTYGRVTGDTTSDYNMYFEMNSGTNRGFVFDTNNVKLFAINPDAVRSSVNLYADHINPNAANTYDLGSTSLYWNQVFAANYEFSTTTDTTLTRLAAGKLGVEGKAVIKHTGAYTSGEVTFSTSAPSGGSSGDIWFQYT